jgi:chaperone modulatory protein CbpM
MPAHDFEPGRANVGVVIIDEHTTFTLDDFTRACQVERTQVVTLVTEGVLEPVGDAPEEWRFDGPSLNRARTALRLAHDFELDTAATALVLDLLGDIDTLRARLRRAGLNDR